MMILTAKVDFKKIMLILLTVSAVLLAVILAFGRGSEDAATSAPAPGSNDSRVEFLKGFGWQVKASPKESGQVRIPEKPSEVFDRYNTLQKDQGYDLSDYAGKKVMRYVYEITNFPGATDPVYATLLVHKNKVIGGDITNTAVNGKVQSFCMPKELPKPTTPMVTAPTEEPTKNTENG